MTSISSNTVLKTFITNLSIQVCSLLTGVITARLLLPVGRGELATVILWPSIMAGFGILGSNWALARLVSERPDEEADLVWTALVLGLILASLSMGVGFFALPYLLPPDKHHLIGLSRLFLLWLPLNFWGLSFITLDQARLRWYRFNLARLILAVPYLAILLGYWALRVEGVAWFVTALMSSNGAAVIFLLAAHRKVLSQGRFRQQIFIALLRQGFPFFLAAVSATIALQLDKALVVALLPTEMVGCYAAAFAFASIHSSLGGTLGVTSFAALVNEPEMAKQARILAQVFRQAMLLYLFAGSGVALFAPLLIVPLFGPGFAPAVAPAAVLALATSLSALTTILNEGLRGRGQTYPGIAAQLLGGSAMALGAWFWARDFGLLGLAGAAVLGFGVQLAVMIVAATTLLQFSPAFLWGLRVEEVKALYSRLLASLPVTWSLAKGGE